MPTLYAPGTTVRVPRFWSTLDPTQQHVAHIVLAYQLILPDGLTPLPLALWEWTIDPTAQAGIDTQAQGVLSLLEQQVGIGGPNLAPGTTVRVTAITTTIDNVSGQVTRLTPEYQLVLPDGTAFPTQTWDVPLDPGAQAEISAQAAGILAALIAWLGPNVSQWQAPVANPVQLAAASASTSDVEATLTT